MITNNVEILGSSLLQRSQFGQTRSYYYDFGVFGEKIHKVIVLSYFMYSMPENWKRAGMFRY
jgi:hypothetical protein